jgi:LPS-assembly lipoprotein
MSLSSRKSVLRAALVSLTLGVSLTGCFQPMYGGPSGQALVQDFQAIKVDPIPERIGHYLANDLIFALNGTGSTVQPRYRLVVNVKQRVQAPLVDTVSGRATSGMLLVDADYRLLPIAGGPPVASGVAFTTASYDRTSQRFANLRAARDAEIRSARSLEDQIRTRLAIDLSRRT